MTYQNDLQRWGLGVFCDDSQAILSKTGCLCVVPDQGLADCGSQTKSCLSAVFTELCVCVIISTQQKFTT